MYVHKRISNPRNGIAGHKCVSLVLLDAAKLFPKAIVLTPVNSMKGFNSHFSILSPPFGVVRFLLPDM